MAINYVLNPLRHRDVHLSSNLLQFGQADSSVHARAAVRTDSEQISQCFSLGMVFHHIFGRRL